MNKTISLFLTILLIGLNLMGCSSEKASENVVKENTVISNDVEQELDFTFEIRKTDKPLIYTGLGPAENNELWIKYSNGKEELIVASKESDKLENTIAGIENPQLSLDKKKVYFLFLAWATSSAVHVYDITTKVEKYLCPGHTMEGIQEGEYMGMLLVNKHFMGEDKDYVIDENGEVIKDLSERLEDNPANSDNQVNFQEEKAEGIKIASVVSRCLYNEPEENINEDTVMEFFHALFNIQGQDMIKEVFIKDIDNKINPEMGKIVFEYPYGVNKEYVDLLAEEIFGVTFNSYSAENGMYIFDIGDPGVLPLCEDSFEEKGIYEATVKIYDWEAGEIDGLLNILETTPYDELEDNYKKYVDALFTVSYEKINGNIRILGFSKKETYLVN